MSWRQVCWHRAQAPSAAFAVAQSVARANETVNAGQPRHRAGDLGAFTMPATGARPRRLCHPRRSRAMGRRSSRWPTWRRAAGITPLGPPRPLLRCAGREAPFSGYLQHFVTSGPAQAENIIADMTTACAFAAPPPKPSTTNAIIQPGPVFAGQSVMGQSYLRFFNTGTAAGHGSM